MITTAPARAMNIADFGLTAGAAANLVVLDQSDAVEALRFHEAPRHVISHGHSVDLARMRELSAAQ
jgi:cytosine/adenosine deaminase-related metal-dependent hydrolase